MRRIMMTIGSTLVVLGSSFIASGQDLAPQAPGAAPSKQAPMQAPAAAPSKQAPMQAPLQAPSKQAPMQAPAAAPSKQAPMQAPTQKIAPVQAPTQAPSKAPMQAPTQSPVQKGAPVQKGGAPLPPAASIENVVPQGQTLAMGRPGLLRRFR